MTTMLTRPESPVAAGANAISEGSPLTYVKHAVVIARRSLIKLTRTPEQLIDVTLQPAIFLFLFTYIFGGALGGGSRHSYVQFLVPGLLGQSIAMAGVALGQNLNADIEKGIFDRFRSLPIGRSAPLVGAVLADVVRYLTVCLMFAIFGTLVGFRVETNLLSALAGLALAVGFALCFCWISVFIGMIARTSGSVQGIMFLIVLPLSFGSNTFVNVNTMPGWLQAFVKNNPISHLVSCVRGLLLGGPVAHDLYWTLGWMAALLAVFVPLALRGYNKRA